MRVFVASLATETNTFSPLSSIVGLRARLLRCPRQASGYADALLRSDRRGARRASRAGHADRGHRDMGRARRARLARGLREPSRRDPRPAAGRLPVDIALAFTARWSRAATTIARATFWRARAIAGPKAVIGAELDMHCHLTEQMVDATDVIVAFKEFPHNPTFSSGPRTWSISACAPRAARSSRSAPSSTAARLRAS